jgi:hypothetical protein
MTPGKLSHKWLVCGLMATSFGLAAVCQAQQQRNELKEPVYRVSDATPGAQPAAKREHPLAPAYRQALESRRLIAERYRDYTATIVKRERIGGELQDHEYIFAKVRHEQAANGRVQTPFSVYLSFVGPARIKGREVIYVAGRNSGKLIAHEGGLLGLVTVNLVPTSALAMRGQRYPITEIGIDNLVRKLVEVAESDMKYGECEVKMFKGAKINGRVCTCMEVLHPTRRSNFRFHKAQIFIDDELGIPIRYAAWDWPQKAGGKPPLLEEYTYLNMKVNVGLTDADFDKKNNGYNFR